MLSRAVGSAMLMAAVGSLPGHGNPVAGSGISDNAESSSDPGQA